MDKWLEEYIEYELNIAELDKIREGFKKSREDFYNYHTQNFDAIETWLNYGDQSRIK